MLLVFKAPKNGWFLVCLMTSLRLHYVIELRIFWWLRMINEEAVIDYFRMLPNNLLGEYITVHQKSKP